MLAAVVVLLQAPLIRAGAGAMQASGLLGQHNYNLGSDNENGANTTGLSAPTRSVVDNQHHLFVADSGNNRVLVYDLANDGSLASGNAVAQLGQSSFFDGGCSGASPSAICTPTGLAVDNAHHRLFVTDSVNSRILIFDLAANNLPASQTATFVLGQPDLMSSGCNQNASASAATLCLPGALQLDQSAHQLYVADYGNSRVLAYDLQNNGTPASGTASAVLGQSDFSQSACNQNASLSAATLCYPQGLALDPSARILYVADSSNSRVLGFSLESDGTPASTTAAYVLGQSDMTTYNPGCSWNNNATSDSTLCVPLGLAIDSASHHLYVADSSNSRLVIYNLNADDSPANATASLLLGQTSSTAHACNQGNSLGATTLCAPGDVWLDAQTQTLFISDTNNNRLSAFMLDAGSPISSEASFAVGQASLSSNNPNGVSMPNASGLGLPVGAAIDGTNHTIFIVDSGNNRVVEHSLSAQNTLVNNAASAVLGQSDLVHGGCNVGGVSASSLCNPFGGVVLDSGNHRLFVSDSGNNRVLVYDLTNTNQPSGRVAAFVLGQGSLTAFSSNGCSDTAASLCAPRGLALDQANHRLFVADSGNNRVLSFRLTSDDAPSGVQADAVLGQNDFGLSGCSDVTAASLCDPSALALDAAGHRLFVSDTNDNRVLVYQLADDNQLTAPLNQSAYGVVGEPNFTTSTCTASASGLCWPSGLAYDDNNDRLIVSDDGNNRILLYDLGHVGSAGMAATGVLGQSSFSTDSCCSVGQHSLNVVNDPQLTYDSADHRLFVPDIGFNRLLTYDFIRLVTGALGNGKVGDAYNATLSSANAQGQVSYAITRGALPAGLKLDSSSGTISGKPTATGTNTFEVTVSDGFGDAGAVQDSRQFTIVVSAAGGVDELDQSDSAIASSAGSSADAPWPRPPNAQSGHAAGHAAIRAGKSSSGWIAATIALATIAGYGAYAAGWYQKMLRWLRHIL